MLQSLFKKVAGLKPTQEFSCEVCQIFKKTFFTGHLRWLFWNFKLNLKILTTGARQLFFRAHLHGCFCNSVFYLWIAFPDDVSDMAGVGGGDVNWLIFSCCC